MKIVMLTTVKHRGKRYPEGETVEVKKEIADELLGGGFAVDPKVIEAEKRRQEKAEDLRAQAELVEQTPEAPAAKETEG